MDGDALKKDLQKDMITEGFQDVGRLAAAAAWEHLREYGGEPEEILAQARFLFCEAFRKYQWERADLTTWVKFHVSKKLRNVAIERAEKRSRLRQVAVDAGVLPARRSFSLARLCREISEDAAFLVETALELPLPETDNQRLQCRKALTAHLERLGWAGPRIEKVFAEIGEAIA